MKISQKTSACYHIFAMIFPVVGTKSLNSIFLIRDAKSLHSLSNTEKVQTLGYEMIAMITVVLL